MICPLFQDAIEYLIEPNHPVTEKIGNSLYKLLDVEVAIMSAFYKKISPLDFIRMSKAFAKAHAMASECSGYGDLPELLKHHFNEVKNAFEDILDHVARLDEKAAKADKMQELFEARN